MGLLITLFLSMTTLLTGSIISTPAVSTGRIIGRISAKIVDYKVQQVTLSAAGLTALIVWIISNFLFLVGAIAAYSFLLAMMRFKKVNQKVEGELEKIRERTYESWDISFLIAFPTFYIIFNIVYWINYL